MHILTCHGASGEGGLVRRSLTEAN